MCVCRGVGATELRTVEESEELLVNVAAAINNLSFYQKETSAIKHNQLHIAKRKAGKPREDKIDLFIFLSSNSFFFFAPQ